MDPTRLIQARKAQGLTQAQVAEATGLDQGAISRSERGHRGLTAQDVVALAQLYQVTADWLLGLAGEGGPVAAS